MLKLIYSKKILGFGVLILFFIVFPLFSYYRWKDKKIEDYYLNSENLKKFKENNEAYFVKSSFPLSNSQNAFGLVWRMCETYELWCKEIKKEKLIKLNFID